jgi:hypothetical protein
MLQLEPTTLYYYNLTLRSFDKSVDGFINNWASDLPLPDGTKSKSKSVISKLSTAKSSTLARASAASAKGKAKIVSKSKVKPSFEPLRLINTSDEEYLRGDNKPSKNSVST